jgi:dTMP kinase
MQLLYVANRHERKPEIEQALASGVTLLCDRYLASSIAYGEAQGLDASWLLLIQRYLPAPDLTILLDIAPETAAGRKAAGRDRYERDLALLSRVRDSYRRQAAAAAGWLRLDGERPRDAVAADVLTAVETRLGPL